MSTTTERASIQAGEAKGKHLVVLGGGSAAFAAAIAALDLGARVTMINDGLPLGGTCVNVGCVPSKTLVRAAEAVHRARRAPFDGVPTASGPVDFRRLMAQQRELVAELRRRKYLDVLAGRDGVEVIEGRGTLAAPTEVRVDGRSVRGDAVLVATGSRPFVPDIPGLSDTGFLTNETLYDLEELPQSLLILGGRYIALEAAQTFARFGSRVTVLQRSPRILPTETPDLTEELSGYLEAEGVEIVTGVKRIERAGRAGDEVILRAHVGGEGRRLTAAALLLATGRRGNTESLGLEELGVETDERGFLRVEGDLSTSVPGLYGAGDVTGEPMYVYTAASEARLAAENGLGQKKRTRDTAPVPWVVFTDPQVAGVGLDELQAEEQGLAFEVSKLQLAELPRALVARDTRGFVKLVRDPASDRLLGARILAPEGGELLMELALAIRHGIPVRELGATLHPYLTLGEAVKLAALGFDREVEKLSCCAS